MRVLLTGATLGLAVLLGACTSIKDHRGYMVDNTLIESVQPGIDNRSSVERTLGRPTFISQFGNKDWYYVAMDTKQAPFHRPRTADQTVLRVRFDPAGNVAGIDRKGMEKVDAVIEAATLRLRPILMTTAAMVLGAVPLALSRGAGAEARQAIGWVVVGGLLLGTLLTLFVIPTVYTLLVRRVRVPGEEPVEKGKPARRPVGHVAGG